MSERLALRLGVAIAFAWMLLALAAVHPRAIGLYSDDGIYLSTARALAEGRGYRQIQLPGEPWQTKYPPAWPWLLSLIWRVAPGFPLGVPLFKAFGIGLTALSAVLGQRVALRMAGLAPAASVVVPALALASNEVLTRANFALSEPLFAVLLAAGLLAWAPEEDESRAGRGTARSLLAAGFLGLAFLARTQGIAPLLALPVSQALSRRWRPALVSSTVSLGVVGGWGIWCWVRSAASKSALLDYYTGYGASLRGSGPDASPSYGPGLVLEDHLVEIPRSIGTLLTPGPPGLRLLVGVAALALVAAGAVALWRRGRRLLSISIAATIALLLPIPWPPGRYLMPILGSLLALAGAGISRLAGSDRPGGTLLRAATPVAVASLLAASLLAVGVEFSSLDRATAPEPTSLSSGVGNWTGLEETAAWIRIHTPIDATLAASEDGFWLLYADRRSVRYWRTRPAEHYQASLRGQTADLGSPERILAELQALGVGWMVIDPVETRHDPQGSQALELGRRILALPEAGARRAFVSSDREHEVWQLTEAGSSRVGDAKAASARLAEP